MKHKIHADIFKNERDAIQEHQTRTHIFVWTVWREHGLLGVIKAGVVRIVALNASLHKLLPVSTKHTACHLRRQEMVRETIRIKPQWCHPSCTRFNKHFHFLCVLTLFYYYQGNCLIHRLNPDMLPGHVGVTNQYKSKCIYKDKQSHNTYKRIQTRTTQHKGDSNNSTAPNTCLIRRHNNQICATGGNRATTRSLSSKTFTAQRTKDISWQSNIFTYKLSMSEAALEQIVKLIRLKFSSRNTSVFSSAWTPLILSMACDYLTWHWGIWREW